MKIYLLIIFLIFSITSAHQKIMVKKKNIDATTQKISYTFPMEKNESLYKDFIYFSVESPQVKVSDWQADRASISCYDPFLKKTKDMFSSSVTITVTAHALVDERIATNLYCNYFLRSHKKNKLLITPLEFTPHQETQTPHEFSCLEALLALEQPKKLQQPSPTLFTLLHAIPETIKIANRTVLATHPFLLIILLISLLALTYILLKKGTQRKTSSLHTLCIFLQTATLALSVLLVFKIAQLVF